MSVITCAGLNATRLLERATVFAARAHDLKKQRQQHVLHHVEENEHGDKCVALNFECKQPFNLAKGKTKMRAAQLLM